MPLDSHPTFTSLAFDVGEIDYADAVMIPLPPHGPTDPRLWAEELFSPTGMPPWVKTAMRIRQALMPVLGLTASPPDTFAIRQTQGEEALLEMTEEHLHCRIAVGVDIHNKLVRVTTVVRLQGWRGQLYFLPVRLAHPLVLRAMLKSAAQRLSVSHPSSAQ